MTDNDKYSVEEALVALDIAKQSHDAVIAWPSGKIKKVKISNSLAGYQQLLDVAEMDPKKLCVAFEPTADYHRNIELAPGI